MRKNYVPNQRDIQKAKKKYLLHKREGNTFHFRSNPNSACESFSITYLPDGTCVMSGDYGCLCWQRRIFPDHLDIGFPNEITNIGYFAEKVNRADQHQNIKEFTVENAINSFKDYYGSEYKEYLKEQRERYRETISELESLENYQRESAYDVVRNFDVHTEIELEDYSRAFWFKFTLLCAVSKAIQEEYYKESEDKSSEAEALRTPPTSEEVGIRAGDLL